MTSDPAAGEPWLAKAVVTGVVIGGVLALAGGALFLLSTRTTVRPHKKRARVPAEKNAAAPAGANRNFTEGEEKTYKRLRAQLASDKEQDVHAALETLYELTKYGVQIDHIKQTGLLDILLDKLSEHSTDKATIFHLARIIANLATSEACRSVIGEKAVDDILWYLKSGLFSIGIQEDLLRVLMNLAVSQANEDIIRTKGGLQVIVQSVMNIPWKGWDNKKALFTALRALVNLSCNQINLRSLQGLGLVPRLVGLLIRGPESTNPNEALIDQDIRQRLIRLVTVFSNRVPFDEYKKIVNPQMAKLLLEEVKEELKIRKELETSNQQLVASTSRIEVIFSTIHRLLSDKSIPHTPEYVHCRNAFRQVFGDRQNAAYFTPFLYDTDLEQATVHCLMSIVIEKTDFIEGLKADTRAWKKIKTIYATGTEPLDREAAKVIIEAGSDLYSNE